MSRSQTINSAATKQVLHESILRNLHIKYRIANTKQIYVIRSLCFTLF